MKISSSINAGITGLQAQSSKLAAISDNLANSQTNGFKRVDTEFSALVARGSNVLYQAGGVRPQSFRDVSDNGPLLGTDNPLDIAISDGGFLPVTDTGAIEAGVNNLPFKLASTGRFRPNDEGFLTTGSGLTLLGWAANPDGSIPANGRTDSSALVPIRIDDSKIEAQPTTEMTISFNLPKTETEVGASGDTLSLDFGYFDNFGTGEVLTFEFTPTIPGAGASNEWSVAIIDSGTAGASNPIAEFTLTFNSDQASGGTLNALTGLTGGAYDSGTGILSITTASGPMTIDLGTPGEDGRLTQIAADLRPTTVSKNGTAPSDMTGVSIDENGYVIAQFESGATQVLYQVPLVDVPNPDGLQPLDGQTFAVSADSGDFYLWDANTGPVGSTVGYALEQSTVDIAQELTSLIQTQRAYSSNAKIIQTVDEMLQETTNLKR